MKIALLQDDFPPRHVGGAGIAAHALALEFQAQGHEVLVITAVRDRKDEGLYTIDGLPVQAIASPQYSPYLRSWISLWNPMTVFKLKRILIAFRPDAVHAHNIHMHLSYASLHIAKKSGARVFLTLHDAMAFHYGKLTEPVDRKHPSCAIASYRITPWQQFRRYKRYYHPFRNAIIRHYLRYARRICAVGDTLRLAAEQNGLRNVETIHNGIRTADWDLPREAVDAFEKRFGLSGRSVILYGGRLSAAKGGEQAVRMMARVAEAVPSALLLVIGEQNAYAKAMQELALELGLEKHILFTGWISGTELKAAYHASDAVCVPSLYIEPFGLISLEAMACAKPVVASCFGGPAEVVIDGTTGYVVNPFDITRLAERTIALLADPQKAMRYGMAGRERAEACFSLADTARKYIALFEAEQK